MAERSTRDLYLSSRSNWPAEAGIVVRPWSGAEARVHSGAYG
jgi:hypothetical protein